MRPAATVCLLAFALGGCGGSGKDEADLPSPAIAPAAAAGARPLSASGQPGRVVLGGTWRFRLEDGGGWKRVSLPYDWNGSEAKLNRAAVGWFRRDLKLPRARRGTTWILRFEGAGHHTTVYLNGRRVADHTGNYLPFEAVLRGARPGRNRLMVRVSSLRTAEDLTHWRKARFHRFGNGGWWNFGGIHREVTLRSARGLDVSRAQALPRIDCPACAARVEVRALVRNLGRRAIAPRVTATAAGKTVALRSRRIPPGAARELSGALTIEHPRLWDIGKGNLYDLTVRAGPTASYRTTFGVRRLEKTSDGRVFLNGRRLFVRGISVHEDDAKVGSAWRKPQIDDLVRRVHDLHATVLRAHYPLNPATLDAMDRAGVLVWDSAPVNLVQNDEWSKPAVRRAAVRVNEETVLRDRGHPSVMVFSIADELPIPVKRPQQLFVRRAAARVRALDPTRMVGLDRVARYGAPDDAHPVWHVIDALGINEYFGWYRGALAPKPPAYARDLPAYFDTLHRQQPHAALFVTEFGAEANRGGSVGEKGTYAFQSRFLQEHVRAAQSRPFLNGEMVWVLRDFRVNQGWTGDNPKPDPPWNRKGLIGSDGRPKPAYAELRRLYAQPGPF